MDTSDTQIPGFYSYRAKAFQGRRGRPYGGVTILVASTDRGTELIAAGSNYVIVGSPECCFIGTYFSPAVNDMLMIERLGAMMALIPPGVPVVLAGDFNARIDALPLPQRSELFLTFLLESGLWLCSQAAPLTYRSPQGDSTIDLVASSLPVESVTTPVLATGHSLHLLCKHKPVLCSVLVSSPVPDRTPRPPRLSKWVSQPILEEALNALCASSDCPMR
jgi:hypothetical protein